MFDRKSGKHDSIPELMKPSVAGPYVPPPVDPDKPGEPPPKEAKVPETKEGATVGSTDAGKASAKVEPEAPKQAEKAATPSGVAAGGGEKPAEGSRGQEQGLDAKEREIEQAFAKRKEGGGAAGTASAGGEAGGQVDKAKTSGSAQGNESGVKGSSILTRGPDGKIRIEKLERVE
ncbi:MAG: hypothetical protein SNJ84_06380, partial [Verrucomicrobiia bacterium]